MLASLRLEHKQFAYFSFLLTHLELKREVRSYTSIPDSIPKWPKCIPVFRPKRRKTLADGTAHTYIREYKGV